MTRLSDLLRGAANRAPVGEASVSLARARRRVRIRRGVRGTANGLVGAGAVALAFVGVVHPALSADGDEASAHNPVPASDPREGDFADLEAGGPSAPSQWASCGSSLGYNVADRDDSLALTVDADEWLDLDGGGTLDLSTRLSANEDVSIRTSGAEAVFLYEGIVVAMFDPAQTEEVLDLSNGDAIDSTLSFPLVNCFDGAPLPAAKYELIVSQSYSVIEDEPAPAPTEVPESSPSPTVAPDPAPSPTAAPDPSPSPTVVGTTSAPETGRGEGYSIDGLAEADIPPEDVPMPYSLGDDRQIAPVTTVTIGGDPVEDPFGDYLWSPPDRPDDILTPDQARSLYQAGLVSEAWDMTPGTSRWIIPTYDDVVFAEDLDLASSSRMIAPSGWYGCNWDGTSGAAFPTLSADLDLLDVSVSFPSRINLSYGWVVDGNPEVHVTVTNASDYSLPGFYGGPNHTLYLVKDGRVVAEAWPQTMYPDSGYEDLPAEGVPTRGTTATAETTDPSAYWGTLPPGDSVTGDYLWRDLNGCWAESGRQSVEAGTYILLASQTLYVEDSDGYPILYDVAVLEGDGADNSTTIAPVPAVDIDDTVEEPIVDPGYRYDWVELQVWTSLGTVTITTS